MTLPNAVSPHMLNSTLMRNTQYIKICSMSELHKMSLAAVLLPVKHFADVMLKALCYNVLCIQVLAVFGTTPHSHIFHPR